MVNSQNEWNMHSRMIDSSHNRGHEGPQRSTWVASHTTGGARQSREDHGMTGYDSCSGSAGEPPLNPTWCTSPHDGFYVNTVAVCDDGNADRFITTRTGLDEDL